MAEAKNKKSDLTAVMCALAPVLNTVIRVFGQIMVTWIRYAHH